MGAVDRGQPNRVEIIGLIDAAIDVTAPQPFGTYVFGAQDIAAEIGRDLERQVFLEAFGNTPAILQHEYQAYERASVFVCVIDHRRRTCAAMMRIIVPVKNGPGLKTLADLETVWGVTADEMLLAAGLERGLQPESCWDIATLAVAPEYRSAASLGLMHIGLYQALGRLGQRFSVEWLVAIFDAAVFRLIRLQLGPVFTALAGERPYLGSARSVPACCQLPKARRHFKKNDPTLYELLYTDSALHAALRHIDVGPATRQVRRVVRQDERSAV